MSAGVIGTLSSDHKLTTDDIKIVFEELTGKVSSKWDMIGIQLDIHIDTLDALRQSGSDCSAKLCKVLVTWLKKGKASWEGIITALKSDTVGENALSEHLTKKYCEQELTEENIQDTDNGSSYPVGVPDIGVNGSQKKSTPNKRLVKSVPQRLHKSWFVQEQKKEKLCIKCRQVAYPALRSSCCDSVYCGFCRTKITTDCANSKCKRKPESIKKDQNLTSKTSKLKMKCPNISKGCDWKGEVYKLKDHLFTSCNPVKQSKKEKKEATKSVNPTKTTENGESSKVVNKEKASNASTSKKPSEKKKERQIRHTSWTPPVNLIMENALTYESTEKFWLSDSFYSHPLGYKLSLAVKLEEGSEDETVKITLAIVSAEGKQGKYLDFPCIGFANVSILNPKSNSHHQSESIMFMLENENPKMYPVLYEQIEVLRNFIEKGCLFFRVTDVTLDEQNYKLWLLDPKYQLC